MFFDKKIRELFEVLTENVNSRRDFDSAMRGNLEPVAKQLRISRAEIVYYPSNSDSSIFKPSGGARIFSISESWNRECSVSISHQILDGDKTVCTYYADSDYFWSEKEKADVKFLGQLLFVLGGNAWLMEMTRNAAVTDAKTGLPNAASFLTYGEKLVELGAILGYTVGAVNVKNFSYINQKMGSRKTDEILKKFGNAVRSFLLEDEKTAFIGGDNFLVLLNNDRVDSLF